MIPLAFRLDTVSVHLVERLEGARRSYVDRPEDAIPAFAEMARNLVEDAARECLEYVDDPQYPDLMRREIIETFLPRYTRLALEHNELEKAGYGAWRGGDPLARLLALVGGVFVAGMISRFFLSPVVALLWPLAFSLPFTPEIRAFWYRFRYRRELQAIVDDMGRIHAQLDVYHPGDYEKPGDPIPGNGAGKVSEEGRVKVPEHIQGGVAFTDKE